MLSNSHPTLFQFKIDSWYLPSCPCIFLRLVANMLALFHILKFKREYLLMVHFYIINSELLLLQILYISSMVEKEIFNKLFT